MTLAAAARNWGRVPWDAEARKAWTDLPFGTEEYRTRIARVQQALREEGLSALITHNQGFDSANVRYLSGFTNPYMGEVVIVIPANGEPTLITDAVAHGEPMHTEIYQTWFDDVRCTPNARGGFMFTNCGSMGDLLIDALHDHGVSAGGPCGLAGALSRRLADALAAAIPELRLQNAAPVMEGIRAVKSDAELKLMREAAAVADHALERAVEMLSPGVSERTVVAKLAATMMEEGADGPLYMMQVVSGPQSGFRNVPPSDRPLADGDPVYIGFGLRYKGYCARAGTGTAVGRPSNEVRALLEGNLAILEHGLSRVRPGVSAMEIARAGVSAADELGLGDETWVGGHGIGVHTHDLPTIAPLSDDILEEGMTFVFEPMVMRAGVATANAERVYVVTRDGVEPLSTLPPRMWEV